MFAKKAYFALSLVLSMLSMSVWAQESAPMPDWVLSTQNGSEIRYADIKDKPVIIHFWATWCPYCKKLQPGLEALRIKYADQGLQLVGVSFNEDPGATPQDVLDERGHQFTTAVNGDELAARLGVRGTPTTFFVFPGGKVMGVTRNSDPENPIMEKAVQRLIEGE